MILIADGETTKTFWSLLEETGETVMFETEGYHPYFADSEYISKSLQQNVSVNIRKIVSQITTIYFYSAKGWLLIEDQYSIIIGDLKNMLTHAKVYRNRLIGRSKITVAK